MKLERNPNLAWRVAVPKQIRAQNRRFELSVIQKQMMFQNGSSITPIVFIDMQLIVCYVFGNAETSFWSSMWEIVGGD
jgi:hypothetical protein